MGEVRRSKAKPSWRTVQRLRVSGVRVAPLAELGKDIRGVSIKILLMLSRSPIRLVEGTHNNIP